MTMTIVWMAAWQFFHPEASGASTAAFPLLQADRKVILLPSDPAYHHHQEAREWHRQERFGACAKT